MLALPLLVRLVVVSIPVVLVLVILLVFFFCKSLGNIAVSLKACPQSSNPKFLQFISELHVFLV